MSKSEWREVALGQVCEFKYGKSLPASDRRPGAIGVYGSNGLVGTHTSAVTNGSTIVIGRKGSFGEVAYSEGSCWPIDTTYYVDSSSTKADLRWLYYRLGGLGLKELNRAAAIPGLNREDAYRRRLLLPPVAEQRRIAEILDQADGLLARRRQSIALLDDLAKSIFLEMFGDPVGNPKGWGVCTIGDLAESATYGTSQKAGPVGDVPVLRMGNITVRGEVDLSDLKYLPKEDVAEKHIARKGDVLFNRTNSADLVGKTAVFHGDDTMAYAGYLVRLRANNLNDPEYISAFLNSDYGKRVLRGMAKSIVGMANINARELRGIRIPAPPLGLQREFATRLRLVEGQKKIQRSSLAELGELFASLRARVFQGEL